MIRSSAKAGIPLEDWDPDDEVDTPAPADPEPENPETTEPPLATEREPDDTPDSADNPSAGLQGGAQAEQG